MSSDNPIIGGVLLDAQKTVNELNFESRVQARLGYTRAARKHANLKLSLEGLCLHFLIEY